MLADIDFFFLFSLLLVHCDSAMRVLLFSRRCYSWFSQMVAKGGVFLIAFFNLIQMRRKSRANGQKCYYRYIRCFAVL